MSTISQFFTLIMTCLCLIWSPLASAQTVNANTATKSQLQTIKGIGEKTAQRILEERERGGSFDSVEDFIIRIKGLGQKRAAKMVEGGLIFNNDQATSTAQPVQGVTAPNSVVAREVAEVKKRFKYRAPSGSTEPYLIKAN